MVDLKPLFTVAFLGLSIGINAQNEGFLITIQGDTIAGKIALTTYDFAFESEVDFEVYTEDGRTLKFINQLVSEYAVEEEGENGLREWRHYYAQIKNYTREFLIPYLDGKARLYADFKSAFWAHQTPDRYNRKNRNLIYYLALAGEEKLVTLSKENFDDTMRRKFQGCPELVDRIGNKYFQFDNIEGIVTYYNRICQQSLDLNEN